MDCAEWVACGSHTQVDNPNYLARLIFSLGLHEISHMLNKQGFTEKFGTFQRL
jgi:hypothetical protein